MKIFSKNINRQVTNQAGFPKEINENTKVTNKEFCGAPVLWGSRFVSR